MMISMNKIKLAITTTILVTCALAGLTLLLPVPADWKSTWALYHLRTALALFVPSLHIVAAWFFLIGMRDFKQELRKGYALVASGIVLLGLGFLQSPAVTLFNLWDTPFMRYGIPNIPFLVPMIILTLALAVFCKSLAITSIWTKWWFTAAFIVAFLAIIIVSPHKASPLSEFTYDFGNAMFALSSAFLLTVGIKLLVVRRHLTVSYAKVVTWLAVGVITEALLVGGSFIVKGLGLEPRSLGGLQDILVLSAIPFIRAGYLFYRLTADTRAIEARENASAIDVVAYIASLASNVQEIDPILDGFRRITAQMQGDQPSESDQVRLAEIYIQLESYLEQKETYRTFTKTQLRDLVYKKFNSATLPSPDKAFWQQLPPLSQNHA
jgi:hypothetical protein